MVILQYMKPVIIRRARLVLKERMLQRMRLSRCSLAPASSVSVAAICCGCTASSSGGGGGDDGDDETSTFPSPDPVAVVSSANTP